MIIVDELVKRFGRTTAVDHLSFTVTPGRVTGFLGPNGSGKSTTMRCMLGLDRADAGHSSFDGMAYHRISRPLTSVGALLDAGYVHPGRTGRNHLRWIAASNGLDRRRVDDVLELVGLGDVAHRRVRGYSLGMRQRLGLAGVMLGDPHTVLLDEPANGLDPEGIRWIRDVLVHLAGEGRTVLVSSHLLSEMALMAHDLVVIGRGRLIEQCSVPDFIERHTTRWIHLRSPDLSRLTGLLEARGGEVRPVGDPVTGVAAQVFGVSVETVGELAAEHHVVLHELTVRTESLEDAFLAATAHEQEYQAQSWGAADPPPPPLSSPPLLSPPPPPPSPPPQPPPPQPPPPPGAGGEVSS
ncbi:MAG: ATP-binding cassette domain-containing protein [Ilumatobacter sp.]|nr:MAG: ATP-binding cassette domain-containing protein [Ilumatobacter sp.]